MKKFDPEMYTISVQKVSIDGETLYLAKVAELEDVREYGDSEAEARELALDTIRTAYEMFQEQGMVFPAPNSNDEPDVSGRLTLRMPKSVHQNLIREAHVEDASLNQVVLTALTSYLEKRSVARVIEVELQNITHIHRQTLSDSYKAIKTFKSNDDNTVRLRFETRPVEFESQIWENLFSDVVETTSWHPSQLQVKTHPMKFRKVN